MEVPRRRRWFWVVFIFCKLACYPAGAQNINSTATTDPDEARALNLMFSRYGLRAADTWNISGELCSGVASDSTPFANLNPGIKCDCSANNNSTCHITELRIYSLDASGPLPDELWNLTHLWNLDLRRNYFTGAIPPAIRNLNRLLYLSFGTNALSGRIPSEIGRLTELRSLSFATNNFSGPLPPEIGNLTRLTQLYVDSCGVNGAIPESFANLRSLVTVSLSDNDLVGEIPAYIGNWPNLTSLRLQGNLFRGAIPSTFSNLTVLNDLRITDVLDVTSSLDFLQNLTSLATINLRNNFISGSIPTFFNNFQNLLILDLSFNNLTGSIPINIFSHSSLTNLYLGNNSLTGTLPSQKSPNLINIDFSYNELSGSLPSWTNQRNLSFNGVANNFTIDSSSSSVLPSGLNCLQRNFPCNSRPPVYSQFAIKCGGPQITSYNGIVYEREDETLGPANYYVVSSRRWAVSNVGLPAESNSPQYQTSSSSQFTNTLDSQLFQTARISAGSLRYYGLGLENGNYTVTLQFAETRILYGARTWWGVGRRIFDVYIQGNLLLRDFNILRENGGVYNRAVVRQFNVSVVNNYVEIHLFWAGKGTCCVPAQGIYGPSISAISATPNFVPAVSNNPPGRKKRNTYLIVGLVVGTVTASLLVLLVVFLVRQKRQRDLEDRELSGIDSRPYTFSYSELKIATNDFNIANKLGQGGFGPVYKGTLGDGRVVAVKQLSVTSHQGQGQFVAEITSISAVQHRNLVKLHGCCIEGDKRLLVYEFLENKSLDIVLFGDGSKSFLHLDWATRYDICVGIARGLIYLHEESRIKIVHRDVKASNILLDSHLTPKISDFGLAKLYDDTQTHISTRVAGTFGYLAPEYAMRGHLTEKVDVFSYGVVAMEIVSGRPNSNTSLEDDRIYLLEWAWKLHEKNMELELVDPRLQEYNSEEARRVIGVALLCTQASLALRPSMSRVMAMLSGDIEVPPITSRPGYLTDLKLDDVPLWMNTDSSTSNTSTLVTISSTSGVNTFII